MTTIKQTLIHDAEPGAAFVAGPSTHVLESVTDVAGSIQALAQGHDPFEVGPGAVLRPFAGTVGGKTGVEALAALRRTRTDLLTMAADAQERAGRALLQVVARTVASVTDVRGMRLRFVLDEDSDAWRYTLGSIEVGGTEYTGADLADEAVDEGEDGPIHRLVEALEDVTVDTGTDLSNLLEMLNESAHPMARAWHRTGEARLGWIVDGEFATCIEQDPSNGQVPGVLVADLEQILATDQRLDG